MKKRLLSLSALALTAMSALAQATWTPPTPPAASELVPGEKVFLYNKDAGGFLRGLGEGGSPYWGSRAGVAIDGADTVIVQKALEANIKEGTTPSGSNIFQWDEEWDGQTYILQNYASHITAPRWDEVWFGLSDLTTIWTDRQNNFEANMNFFWNVTKNDNGTYSFSVSPKAIELANPDLYNALYEYDNEGNVTKEPAIKGGERIGVSISDVNGEVRFEGATEDLAFEWIVVKVEDFAALDTAAMKAQLATYREAMSLKNYLEEKAAEYTEVDFTEVYNVYNNTSSTIEELQAAKAKVDALIVAWQAGTATPDNPKVLEGAIQNATFDVIGDFWGWQGTAFGAGGTKSTCAEHYEKNYNTYQDINVELPIGIYRVAVKGFYRSGGTDTDWNTKDDPSSRHAKLYAVSGEDSLYTGIPALSQCASPSPVAGAGQEVSYAGMYLPNSMADFTVYKEAGLVPEVYVLVPVNNGKLRIGLVKETKLGTDWTIVDDFTLEYYGSTLAAYELYKEKVLASFPEPEAAVSDEALYNAAYLTAYTEAYNALATATDAATISSASTKLAPAYDALNDNVKAYQNYKAAVEEAETYLADNGGSLNEEADTVIYLTEYISGEYAPGEDYPFPNGAYLYIIGGEEPGACTLETEQVNEEIAYVHALVQGAAKATMEGGDVSNLLVNPDFSNGATGWTLGSGCSPAFSWGEAEVFGSSHGHVDISQTITNVPAGIYSISVKAFERPAANGGYDGTEEPKVFLFMGDLETPVQNIVTGALPEDQAVDRENCLLSNDYLFTSADGTISGYVPNGMEGASIAFAAGRYVQECYGIVGEDGIMKIGLTSHGVVPHWVLFDDFKLTYWGKNIEAMTEVLTGKYENGLEYLETYGSEMTQPAYNALNDALVAAEAAVDSEDFDQMSAALTAIAKATIAAGENRTAVVNLTSALDALDIAMTDYESSASEGALAKAAAILEQVGDDAFLALTTEELIAVTEDAKTAAALLAYNELYLADLERVPTIPTDPAAYPFDMAGYLQNGDFTSGKDYWTETFGGGNNGALGNAYEYWNGSAAALKFDINQTLYALPHGKYTLEAELANAKNGAFVEANEGRAHLYADVIVIGEDTVTTSVPVEPRDADCSAGLDPYKIEFIVPEHKDGMKVVLGIRTVGTMAARWFAYDNFVLKLVEDPVTGIEGVETKVEAATPVAIYNISGTRVNKASKGINIVKMSDGSVKKVLVK